MLFNKCRNINNDWSLGRIIGFNDLGVVRRCYSRKNRSLIVAIKTVEKHKIQRDFDGLVKELHILRRINHPSIAKVFDIYED
jgi:serine/threonine protein kinase